MTGPATRVRIYGELGAKFGREHHYHLATRTPAEALRALQANRPDFASALRADGRYCILANRVALDAGELTLPTGANDIRIVPLVAGGGTVGKILLGGALIGLSIWAPGFLSVPLIAGGTATGASIIGAVGWSLTIGGVSQMLFTPRNQKVTETERPENKPSYAFNGPVNTTGQGNCVPVLYGRLIHGGQVVSAGLYTEEFSG